MNEYVQLPAGSNLQGGKYRIIKVLGQGGFGITYLAEQTGLGMKVAIKEFFLKGSCQRDSTTSYVSVPVTDNRELVSKCLKKFRSEARKIASLNNDHIVSIIDIFDENGTSYYVMKHLSGGSLSDRISSGAFSEGVALNIIREMSDALGSIHSNGLLHLDVKPANILFDDKNRAVLIDFGVSKYVDSEKDNTTTSSLVGFSRGFAPLEQINAIVSSLTPATDIYALGATLYNLVIGVTPPDATIVMDSGLPAMPDYISEEVKNAITRCMQPRKKDRPQNVETFLGLLPEKSLPAENDEVTIVSTANLSNKNGNSKENASSTLIKQNLEHLLDDVKRKNKEEVGKRLKAEEIAEAEKVERKRLEKQTKLLEEEKKRLEAENHRLEEDRKRQEELAKKKEEEARVKKEAEEQQRLIVLEQIETERQRMIAAEQSAVEERKRLDEEKKHLEIEKKQLEEAKKRQEELANKKEQDAMIKKEAEEQQRLMALEQIETERQRMIAAEQSAAEERKRLDEEKKHLEIEKKQLEEAKKRQGELANKKEQEARIKKEAEEQQRLMVLEQIETERQRIIAAEQSAAEERKCLDDEKKHLEREKKQLDEEKKRLEKEKKQLDEEKKRLSDQKEDSVSLKKSEDTEIAKERKPTKISPLYLASGLLGILAIGISICIFKPKKAKSIDDNPQNAEAVLVDTIKTEKQDTVIVPVQPKQEKANEPVIHVIGISLDKKELTIPAGSKETLKASVMPYNATEKSYYWSSSDKTIATVSGSGVVTAKSEGITIVTVTTKDGRKSDSCTVTVDEVLSDERQSENDVKEAIEKKDYKALEGFADNGDASARKALVDHYVQIADANLKSNDLSKLRNAYNYAAKLHSWGYRSEANQISKKLSDKGFYDFNDFGIQKPNW